MITPTICRLALVTATAVAGTVALPVMTTSGGSEYPAPGFTTTIFLMVNE